MERCCRGVPAELRQGIPAGDRPRGHRAPRAAGRPPQGGEGGPRQLDPRGGRGGGDPAEAGPLQAGPGDRRPLGGDQRRAAPSTSAPRGFTTPCRGSTSAVSANICCGNTRRPTPATPRSCARLLEEADFVFIHDPQPAALLAHVPRTGGANGSGAATSTPAIPTGRSGSTCDSWHHPLRCQHLLPARIRPAPAPSAVHHRPEHRPAEREEPRPARRGGGGGAGALRPRPGAADDPAGLPLRPLQGSPGGHRGLQSLRPS